MLTTLASGMLDDYRTLQRWYEDVPGLFPRTMHLVLHSPLRGIGAAVRVQEYVAGPVKDLLRGFTDDELAALMSRAPLLAGRIRSFAAATRWAWDHEGRFLDMIGHDNVMLIERSSGPDLCVADLGIMDLASKRRQAPKAYAHAARIVERLERLAARSAEDGEVAAPLGLTMGAECRRGATSTDARTIQPVVADPGNADDRASDRACREAARQLHRE